MPTTDWMSAVAAAASAIAGIAAAFAAVRSANSAEASRRLAETVELRAVLRDISLVAAQAQSEVRQIEALARRLIALHRSLAAFGGGVGGSRLRSADEHIGSLLKEAHGLAVVLAPFATGSASLHDSTSQDATRALHNQQQALAKLQAIASELRIDLDGARAQELQFLQAALNPPPPR